MQVKSKETESMAKIIDAQLFLSWTLKIFCAQAHGGELRLGSRIDLWGTEENWEATNNVIKECHRTQEQEWKLDKSLG
jgi:hypothetical protein